MADFDVMKFLEGVASIVKGVATVADKIDSKAYGIVHDSHEIEMCGKKGLLVWDYVLYNELTFEESDTQIQHSLFTSTNDEDTRARFDALVEKYGK